MHYQTEPNGRVWLIGGTSESAFLARAIARLGLPCTISVTTAAARALYPDAFCLQVWVGRLDVTQIGQFLQQQKIVAILDASHPFAVEISRLAIASATQYQIPYLRYDRPSLELVASSLGENLPKYPLYFDSLATLLAGDYLEGRRVLLTIGYKHLSLFRPWHDRATLFARILPSVVSLEAALAAGFTGERLIALRPPISTDLEKALWRQWNISLVVSKASGAAGGEDVKRLVADELGVSLAIVARPDFNYQHQTSDLSIAIEFCQQSLWQNS